MRRQREGAIPDPMRSYVIGTFAVGCRPRNEKCYQAFNSISLYFRGTGGGGVLDSTQGAMFGGDTAYDFVNLQKSEKGVYFCRIVPAGRYGFRGFSYWNFAGGGSGFRMRKESEFDLPFTTTTGTVTDVGRLKLTTERGKNLFGLPLAAPGVLQLSSNTPEDTQAALRKCPQAARDEPVAEAGLRASMAGASGLVQDAGGN